MKKLLLVIIILLFSGCASKVTTQRELLHHVVLVWFEANTTQAEKEMVFEASKALAHIRHVEALHIGKAVKTGRNGVDDSFDMGLTFVFEDRSQMQAYLIHPFHKEFIQKYIRGKVAKVLIFDY